MADALPVPLDEVFRRAGEFFVKRSPVHSAARRIVGTLRAMDIPFAVVGAMAANAHGHVRTTEDVDILLTREGLARFKAVWLGRGWVERFPGSKGMRDAVDNVQIDVLLAGEYPGDGRPKPVVFPDPATLTTVTRDDLPVVPLRLLLELKMASAMTAPHRMQDYADVMQLIRRNKLPKDYEVDPYVTEKYVELWALAQIEDEDS